MQDVVVTGASRGIGRALVAELPRRDGSHLVMTARDDRRLRELADGVEGSGERPRVVPGDVGSLAAAHRLGLTLAETLSPGATLVHNAGVWPMCRELNEDGLESAFVVNHLGPLAMQAPLSRAGLLSRILVVSAGLIVKGHAMRRGA